MPYKPVPETEWYKSLVMSGEQLSVIESYLARIKVVDVDSEEDALTLHTIIRDIRSVGRRDKAPMTPFDELRILAKALLDDMVKNSEDGGPYCCEDQFKVMELSNWFEENGEGEQ
jgi:hypothetical protein